MDDPVRLYADDHQRLPSTVSSQLKKQRMELVEQLATGGASDFATYTHTTGIIAGIDLALDICAEANKELVGT